MSYVPRILAFGGSLREESYNHKLVSVAARGAEAAGAKVTLIRLGDYPLPVYDGDIEAREGLPDNARKLKQLMKEHDGFLISAPEYNSSVSGALKNAIDWASRREGDEGPLECFKGKTVVLMSASPGALGGLRGLVHLRAILGNIQALVLPEQKAVPKANEAFDLDGGIEDPALQEAIEGLGARLAEMLATLHGNLGSGSPARG